MGENTPVDKQALALTHAIALQESGSGGKPNYNATGDAGTSKGAYQWQPGNFEAAAKSAGLDPNDFSPENQDKVAYSEVKGYKDKGYDPGQIASLWNSGSPNNWQNHSGTTTINGKTISYDTPAYVKKVQKYYQQLSPTQGGTNDLLQGTDSSQQGGAVGGLVQPSADSSQLDSQIQALTSGASQPAQDNGGIIQDIKGDLSGNAAPIGQQVGDAVKGVGNFLFPIAGDLYNDATGKNSKTALQQVGDAGLSALPFIPGLGEVGEGLRGAGAVAEGAGAVADAAKGSGLLGGIAKNAAIGYGGGTAASLAQGNSLGQSILPNAQNVTGALTGGITSGILGGKGSTLGKTAATALTGAGVNAAGTIAQGDTDPGDIAASAAEGGLFGGVAGLTSAGEGKLLAGKSEEGGAAKQSVVNQRYQQLSSLEDSNAPLRRVIQAADDPTNGVDVKKLLAGSNLLEGSVDKNGTINTMRPGGALSKFNDFIAPYESVVMDNIRRENKSVPVSDVEKYLKNKVMSSNLEGNALTTAMNKVDSEIEGYNLRAGEGGTIPVATLQSAKINKYSNIDYTNPVSKAADKVIANGLKNLVHDNVDSIDTNKVNEELSKWYGMQSVLKSLNGKKVEGGRLGKYFAEGIGGLVGTHIPLGPLGPIVGAEVAKLAHGKHLQNTFRKGGNAPVMGSIVKGARTTAESAPVRKLQVQNQGSDFTNDVPTIDAGKPAPRKRSNLPSIKY